MKMAKVTPKDIEAAGAAMGILNAISGGYYPSDDGEEDAPTRFDPTEWAHLHRFYEQIGKTLDISPGWPGRVIGGMCFVIMYDENEIIDPDADFLEIHPRFEKVAAELEAVKKQRDGLLDAIKRLEARGFLNPVSCADDATLEDMKRMREAILYAVGGTP